MNRNGWAAWVGAGSKGAQSGIRVIYAHHEDEDWIEFLEIYYKGDRESEDRERIVKKYKK